MLTLENCHDPAGDIQEYQMFCLIADKIEANPALLQIPIANVDRWIAKGHRAAVKLNEWREACVRAQTSNEGLHELLTLLRDDSEETRWFKGFAPTVGILTPEDRRRFPWISRH